MNIWHDISPKRIQQEDFCAVIEITKGGKAKYELDKETSLLRLDRVWYTSTHYPSNYGYILRTYAQDDVLVLCSENILPMSLVRCYAIGVIVMDDGGEKDEKIITIPFEDPTYDAYQDISQLPGHIFEEMRHFFSVYKQLEHSKETEISEVKRVAAAREIIADCMERYLNSFCR